MIAGMGALFALVGLFLVPWFQVDEIAVTNQQPAIATSQSNQSTTQTLSNNGRFGPMRDLHDQGVVGWASTRRVKRDIAIVALVVMMGIATLIGAMAWRWRLCIALAGAAGLAAFLLTLLDFQRLDDLVRQRLTFGPTSTTIASIKLVGAQPGTGMVAVLLGLLIALFGIMIALLSNRRGKLLTPLQQ
jgi:hypothetical protein